MSLRWTEQEYAAHVGKRASATIAQKPAAVKRREVMNGLEGKFAAEVLDVQKLNGEIADYRFEAITLRLAKGARFTPDFTVWLKDNTVRFIETKGFWRESARLRIKIAAEMYPQHKFIVVQKLRKKDGDGWKYETF